MENQVNNQRFGEISSSLTAVDFKMISAMRLLLSFAALIIVYIDPTEPDRFVEITYLALLVYFIYAFAVFIYLLRGGGMRLRKLHWVDIVFYAVLISLSSGTNSVFFFFFLFSILTASFSWGFRYGISTTIISTVLFTVIGYISAPSGTEFEMNRFLLRPIYLLLLGYMMSFWGEREIRSKRRLALLRDISRIANPRLGPSQTIDLMLRNLLIYYEADTCLLITGSETDDELTVFEKRTNSPLEVERTNAVAPLLRIPERHFISYQSKPDIFARVHKFEILPRTTETAGLKFQPLADLLNADYFITAPVLLHGELKGRLYLTASRRFPDPDLNFLNQITEYVFPTLENIRVLEELASAATEQQRFRISRDIHDGTIQPYIGLKLGLESLALKLEQGKSIRRDLKNLLKLTESGISNLRRYVRDLEVPAEESSGSVLFTAIRQNFAKYEEFYGIKVAFRAPSNITVNDRLAAEVFQLINEGLSNIRRHTRSNDAVIECLTRQNKFVLIIENSVTSAAPDFVPKSISGRVEHLGGITRVIREQNFTRISIEIPLL